MWGFDQMKWIQEAARDDIKRHQIDDLGGSITIPDGNVTLWRYMDLAKLLALVGNESLYFSSIKNLKDPFEGQWSDRTIEMIHERDELWVREENGEAVIRDLTTSECLTFPMQTAETTEDAILRWSRVLSNSNPETYVNCWYQEDEESEAMWHLFAGERYGVAVRTTASLLVGCFTETLPDYLGCVNYLTYDKQAMPIADLPPVFYKRRGFMHEREVRVVVAPARRKDFVNDTVSLSEGVNYKVDPSSLIQEIIVSPYSPNWLIDVVRSTVSSLGLEATIVRKSDLDRRPLSEFAYATIRSAEAYFAFLDKDATVPLRVWTNTRARAELLAGRHWGLNPSDRHLMVWKESECKAGFATRPSDYLRIADPIENGRLKDLDPERDLY